MRRLLAVIIALSCLVACFTLVPSAFAQAPPFYAGSTQTVYGNIVSGAGNGNANKTWLINYGSNYLADTSTPNGWIVTFAGGGGMTVTAPSTASLGQYTVSYATNQTFKNGDYVYSGPKATFQIVSPPPALPPAGNPAFSWQGSVGGVNTGNGNKTTTLPIVGWTQRGGMGVSCTLYHNSQGPNYVSWGNKWTLSYFSYISGGSAAPIVHWDNGLSYSFTKNADGSYTPISGILDKLTYSSGVFTLTTTGNTVYTFGYVPGNAYLSTITDMDGNVLTIGHNSDTTISAVTDVTGRKLTYAYTAGKLTSVTDPLGRVWTFNYGTAGGTSSANLWYVTLPVLNGQSYSTWFGYDGNSNITGMQTPQGHAATKTATFGYDSSSSPRLIWAKDPLGNQTTFAYNSASTVITDPNGHSTTQAYQNSRLIKTTDALNYSVGTTYDSNNIVTSTKDKRGNVWNYSSHFTTGNATSTSQDPLGNSTTTTYDAKNKATQSIDAIGNVTTNTYSTDGKEDLLTTAIAGVASSSYPFHATSSVGGYNNGLPTTFTDPLSFSSSVAYNANGYANSTTDANTHTATAIFNALGWKTSSTDANNHTATNTYDNWGRVTDVQAPDATHTGMTYDLDGNVLTVTDANHHTVTNVYDADERLIQTQNGRGDLVNYTYDGTDSVSGASQKGLLSSKMDGNGHTTSYSYTARNEPSATYYPDGTSESVTYDAGGNTLTRTKADSKVIKYAYDAANRLTDITYPTLHPTHFDYDANGRKIDMTDATGTTNWYYTNDGIHLGAQATPQGTVNYTYDGDGRPYQRSINTPSTGYSGAWTNTYDAGGRLTKLQSPTDGTTTFTYNLDNTLATKTKGNGNYETYAYNTCNEVTGIGYYWADTTLQSGLTYSYDPGGNVSVNNQGGYSTTYGYDGADQLTSETSSGTSAPPTLGFTYDHNGNRLTQTTNGAQSQSFTYDAHDKLTSGTAANETDGHDLNGNETSIVYAGRPITLVYDEEDRLTSFTTAGITDTFTYNGLGLRVGKVDSTGTYAYICDGTSPASPVLSDGHALYTPGLSENRGGTSSYYGFDKLGNLWTLDGSSKSLLAYEDNSGFGGITASGGSNASPFKFSGGNGGQSDADTGLTLLGHRYYDGRQGRFINQDHAKSGNNWYAYAGNNPVNKTDPSGLMPMDGPGSSAMGSPGYSGIGDGAGYAENFSSEEDARSNYNQGVDNAHSINNTAMAVLQALCPQTAHVDVAIYGDYDWGETPGAAGDAAHIASLYLPDGTLKTTAELVAEFGSAAGMAKYSATAIGVGTGLMGDGWSVFTSVQCAGRLIPIGAGMMGEGLGSLALGIGATGFAIAGTAAGGYQIGTAISNYPISPGYTVNDALSNKMSGFGSWLQQNTSFGH